MPHKNTLAAAVIAHSRTLTTVVDLADLRAARIMFERPRAALTDVNAVNVKDPTGATVVDPDRLRVRAAYIDAITTIEHSTSALIAAEANLRAALEPYGEQGDDFPERPADPDHIRAYAA